MKNNTALDRIYAMLGDLEEKNRSKSKLMEMYITERLNKSVETYSKSLLESSENLKYRKNERVVMRVLSR